MCSVYHDSLKKEIRKFLREEQTPQEGMLWQQLRAKRAGAKWRRQVSIGPYIVDFCCKEFRIVVELDGSQHLDNTEYDTERTKYLEKLGYTVLRFWNNEVNTNLEEVMLTIQTHLSPALSKDMERG